jgi:hypothetical protein
MKTSGLPSFPWKLASHREYLRFFEKETCDVVHLSSSEPSNPPWPMMSLSPSWPPSGFISLPSSTAHAVLPPPSLHGSLKGLRVHDNPVLKYIVGDTRLLHPVLGTILRPTEPNQYTISHMSVRAEMNRIKSGLPPFGLRWTGSSRGYLRCMVSRNLENIWSSPGWDEPDQVGATSVVWFLGILRTFD